MNNPLVDYIRTNPNWEEDLSKKDPFNMFIRRDEDYPGLVLFTYNQISSDFYNPIVRVSRAIILKINERWGPEATDEAISRFDCDHVEVVCWPFNKFGNYGEGYADKIDWSTTKVQEMVDGSIMKLWWLDSAKKWMWSTNGTITTP